MHEQLRKINHPQPVLLNLCLKPGALAYLYLRNRHTAFSRMGNEQSISSGFEKLKPYISRL